MKRFNHGSAEAPISVPSQHMDRYVPSEYAFIRKTIGPYQTTMQALLNVKGRSVDKITVRTPQGDLHTFFFDISGPMDKWGAIFRDAAKKMGLEDWEVVGPEGELYGRYKAYPTKEQIPLYALVKETKGPMIQFGDTPGPAADWKLPVAFAGLGIFLTGVTIQLFAKDGTTTERIGLGLELLGMSAVFAMVAGLPKYH